MKAIFTALLVLATTASAHAVSTLGYDFRTDYQSLNYNDAANVPASQRAYLKVGRLYFKGALNERISYEVRWGFYKPAVETATSNSQRDNLNSSVEFANVTDKMSDMFSLTVGKFGTEIGGLEGGTSGADLYMVTPFYGHNGAVALTGKNLGINQSGANNLLYATGVKGDFSAADQHIYVVATNNQGDAQDATGKFNQNRGLLGISWKGQFAEKTWTGLLSYHEVSPQGAATDGGNKHSFASAGAKYDNEAFVGMLEYSTTDYKDGASGNKDTVSSVLAKFGYKMDQFIPRLEVFSAEEKIGIGAAAVQGTNKFMGYGAVLEYKPTADNFRYHIAYNSITTKPIAGNDLTRNEIVVGARLFGDFLK